MQFGINVLGHWALVSHLLPTVVTGTKEKAMPSPLSDAPSPSPRRPPVKRSLLGLG